MNYSSTDTLNHKDDRIDRLIKIISQSYRSNIHRRRKKRTKVHIGIDRVGVPSISTRLNYRNRNSHRNNSILFKVWKQNRCFRYIRDYHANQLVANKFVQINRVLFATSNASYVFRRRI